MPSVIKMIVAYFQTMKNPLKNIWQNFFPSNAAISAE